MYKYPKFKGGKQVLTRIYDNTSAMMMNITAYNLKKGESVTLADPDMETAIHLMKCNITFYYEEKEEKATRSGVFTEAPTCLHVSKDVEVVVYAEEY
ncbi:MAG: 5-deoxy-glucuronate isomerase, partial [Clostridia bacterium]|nr:5-deoxy-glucuronate isomerase [Clostridia bacterium]